MTDWTILSLKQCESTNSELKKLKASSQLDDKTALMTEFQFSGRGQGKNNWHSKESENLLFSLYKVLNIPADQFFQLNVITSLSICDALKELEINATIKWANDIYFKEKKLAGILIENSLISGNVADSIIGIGLNVNQADFPEWIPNPVSLKNITGAEYNCVGLAESILTRFDYYFEQLQMGEAELLLDQYHELLYQRGKWARYVYQGELVNGHIQGVMPDGRLIIELENGKTHRLLFGEISFNP
jgi:BirA family transcriptional regulator, biotin operon repressor / biotin---[acetyl-CoA-carboxylase] ligase